MGFRGNQESVEVVIAGGGIVGFVLALALKKHTGVIPRIYEKAHAFHDDVGAALGMYPNGLRVLRDIDPALVTAIREQGAPYEFRKWEQKDGTVVAQAQESVLTSGDDELSSIGIRRWKLQKVLYDAVVAEGIPVHFNKATVDVIEKENGLVQVVFEDGSSCLTQILFACDGGKSRVREVMAGDATGLKYTGTTCLMGMSNCPIQPKGISFPSSQTGNFHAVYFPTGEKEHCFQIHLPIDEEEADSQNWGNLSTNAGRQECRLVAAKLRDDEWHEKYIQPINYMTHAVKVGFCLLEPKLEKWVYGKRSRIILVGDSAHPPVPYVGQGAQQGIEDAGTIALLMKLLCMNSDGRLDLQNFEKATKLYEQIRIPRAAQVLECSKNLGMMQELRAHDDDFSTIQDSIIKAEIMLNGTLPLMFQGAEFDYRKEVEKTIEGRPEPVTVSEEEFESMMHMF